jgi:nucleotide-binding universal stress UspA family protein
MLSRILVAMDDSDQAGHALAYALDNFPDADVTVLHVVGVPSMMMGEAVGLTLEGDDIDEAAAGRAERVFERAREVASERGREIDTVVGIGHPARNIVDRAEEYDTVIVGGHGKHRDRATRRFLVGNVAETVSKRSPVPVTIVR